MKLIVAGSSGFVGSEVIRQSLRRPEITSVIALARKPVTPPARLEAGLDWSKLKSVLVKDYGTYPDDVKKEFTDADACIWTVAVTPTNSYGMDFNYVKYVCQDSTLAGLKAIQQAGPAKPFRFLYMSGANAERDQTKTPSFKPEYSLMRGETETRVLAFGTEHGDQFQTAVTKPGFITGPGEYKRNIMAFALKVVVSLPSISVGEVAAAMLEQVTDGFEKDTLLNEDLTRIGRRVLEDAQ